VPCSGGSEAVRRLRGGGGGGGCGAPPGLPLKETTRGPQRRGG